MKTILSKDKPGTIPVSLWGLALLMLLLSQNINAQRAINATGGTGTISGDVFSYSIGEMILVSTASTGNNFYTQGLLQNDDVNLEVHDNQYLAGGLELYPNPAANVVYLQPSFEGGGEFSLQLFDMRGRLVKQLDERLQSGFEKQSLDVSNLQEGTYLLQAVLNKEGKRYQHTFKIVKISNQ